MRKSILFLFLITIAFPLISNSFAQENMPILDVPEGHIGLPNDYDFDIIGFKLLDTTPRIDELFSKYPNKNHTFRIDENQNIGLRDNRGNAVNFKRGRQYTGGIVDKETLESIYVQHSSPLNDERAISIQRQLNFQEEISADSLISSVKEKYGAEPTLVIDSNYSLEYRYMFHEGALIPFVGGTVEIYSNELTKKCQYTRNEVTVGSSRSVYRFQEDRKKKYDGCNGEVKVVMVYGSRKDLYKSMRISMWDYDLAHKDLRDQDQFLLKELEAARTGKVGKEAPKL